MRLRDIALPLLAVTMLGTTAVAQDPPPQPPAGRGQRVSPPQPQQQQTDEYFVGTWTFTWIGRTVGSYTNGEKYLDEITGSISLDVKSSTTSNLAGDDIYDALDRLESSLIALGYTAE